MPWFYCFIRGDNFPGERWGSDQPYGFYTHRYVEADTAADAEQKALTALREDSSFELPEGMHPPKEAIVYFEEISELENKPTKTATSGATWFKMDDADFEEFTRPYPKQ